MANQLLADIGTALLAVEQPAALAGGFCVGLGAVLTLAPSTRWGWRVAFVGGVAGLAPWGILNEVILPNFTTIRLPVSHVWQFAGMATLGGAVAATYMRWVVPAVDQAAERLTKGTALERNGKTDVRTIHQLLPAVPPAFDPLKFWGSQGFFLGIGEGGRPVYWPGDLPHVQVTGTTGAGKGVFLSMLAAQCAARGEAVFYLDPKDDEWAPHVLAHVAAQRGVPFHFVDLRPSAGPQINLLAGASEEEITELFYAGFGLSERGTDADFYRLADRQAAKKMARLAAAGATPAALWNALWNAHGATLREEAPGFAGQLQEMAELPAVNADLGRLDLEKIINDGGAVFVVGSMRNTAVIRMQRMLLVRLIQLAERRDRTADAPRKICIVLDELKYHVSRPALEALGAARDKGVHLVLAHQSLADLRDCPADLDPEAVVGAVMENGKVKLAYRVEDPDTAEWLARKSGRIQADDEIRRVTRNAALAETVDNERTIRQAERFFIDDNMVLNLKPSQAVLFGLGLPQFLHTSPIRVTKTKLVPRIVAGDRVTDPADLISPRKNPQEKI